MTSLTGFVNIIKPTGMTSSDVVLKVKKILGTKKVGHLGTLDPAASGVLPISIGRGTKFFDYFLSKEKEYVALVQFGIETDTLDSEGKILSQNNLIITSEMIEKSILKFIGNIEQIPPKYSAIKINGEKACDLARKNVNFEIKSRNIDIFSIKILKNIGNNQFLFKVHCSAGTYIRTLFSDIARDMGTVSITPVIIRTKSGLFNLKNAITLEELENNKKILSIFDIFDKKQKIEVDNETAFKLINGVKILVDENSIFPENEEFFVIFEQKVIGFYKIIDKKLNIIVYLYE